MEPAVCWKSDNMWTDHFIWVSVMCFSWSLAVPCLVEISRQPKLHACSVVLSPLVLELSKEVGIDHFRTVDWIGLDDALGTYMKMGGSFPCVTLQWRNKYGTIYSTLGVSHAIHVFWAILYVDFGVFHSSHDVVQLRFWRRSLPRLVISIFDFF